MICALPGRWVGLSPTDIVALAGLEASDRIKAVADKILLYNGDLLISREASVLIDNATFDLFPLEDYLSVREAITVIIDKHLLVENRSDRIVRRLLGGG